MGMSEILLYINFWQAKQLEYWLKDNYPDCNIRVVDINSYRPPDEKELYKVTGNVDIDLACILKLKYGQDIKI